jgi:hypothetical protein
MISFTLLATPKSDEMRTTTSMDTARGFFFVIVDPFGHIVFLSKLDIGHKHDATHFNESKAVELLEEFYELEDDWTFCLGGDKAYPNIDLPDGWELFVTMTAEEPNLDEQPNSNRKKKNENAMDVEGRTRSPEIAKWRSVVERAIGAIKRWQILSNLDFISKVDGALLQKLLTVICALVNWERKNGRKKAW